MACISLQAHSCHTLQLSAFGIVGVILSEKHNVTYSVSSCSWLRSVFVVPGLLTSDVVPVSALLAACVYAGDGPLMTASSYEEGLEEDPEKKLEIEKHPLSYSEGVKVQ